MHPFSIFYVLVATVVARVVYVLVLSPTRHIPGPFLARFTRLWYFHSVWKGTAEKDNIALHRKHAKNGQYYAPIVRLGPNMFSIRETDQQVYGIGSKLRKSDWYEGWKHPSPDRWTMFPDRDIQRHNQTRKKFQNLYSLTSLKSYEPYVDNCIVIFMEKLQMLADQGQFINLGHWLQCYAFDVIGGAITYSKRFGFLDNGKDVNGIIQALDSNMPYSTLVGIYAWLHPYLFQVMQRIPGSGAASRQKLNQFTQENKDTREAQRKAWEVEGKGVEEKEEGSPEDFLDKLLNMRNEESRGVTDYHCYIMGLSNIIAGSDTTAVTLSSILYHLIKTPRVMEKLRKEIKAKTEQGLCGEDIVSFKDSQEMPYLQACIKEGLRVHAAVGLPLWRTVNEGGMEIAGVYLPASSEVGLNAWVAHSNEDVWGRDAHEFRPERWIEAEQKGADELRRLEYHYLPFGLGSRTCIGRHISYLEITKLIPQIVRNFDFQLQYPDVEWTCKNYWFVKPESFYVRIVKLAKV